MKTRPIKRGFYRTFLSVAIAIAVFSSAAEAGDTDGDIFVDESCYLQCLASRGALCSGEGMEACFNEEQVACENACLFRSSPQGKPQGFPTWAIPEPGEAPFSPRFPVTEAWRHD